MFLLRPAEVGASAMGRDGGEEKRRKRRGGGQRRRRKGGSGREEAPPEELDGQGAAAEEMERARVCGPWCGIETARDKN